MAAKSGATQNVRQQILSVLSNASEPLTAAEIAKQIGRSPSAIQRWLFAFHHTGMVERFGKRNAYYRLIGR